MTDPVLKAPYPYPGGKSTVADMVWERLGDVDNFIEPFAGSLAVLLRRPAAHFANGYRVETANDANHYIVNFWRCLEQGRFEEVAKYADNPVMEADLHARHRWLVRSDEAHGWKMQFANDPHYCDPKIAGWWVWGQCCWIGSGWCGEGVADVQARPIISGFEGQTGRGVNGEKPTDWAQTPVLGDSGRGVIGDAGTSEQDKRQALGNSRGVTNLGRPQLADAFDIGRGVNSNGGLQVPLLRGDAGCTGTGVTSTAKRPNFSFNNLGCGVNSNGPAILPGGGTCDARREWLTDWMRRLADRLRLVRTCYGHWNRVCDSDSTLTRLGITGVFLDPPYPLVQKVSGKKSRAGNLYATDNGTDLCALRDEVLDWCRRWGQDSKIRVALCCYEGDGYEPLATEGWSMESWEANGGYGNQSGGKGKAENAKRERIYFSPACVAEPDLFAGVV